MFNNTETSKLVTDWYRIFWLLLTSFLFSNQIKNNTHYLLNQLFTSIFEIFSLWIIRTSYQRTMFSVLCIALQLIKFKGWGYCTQCINGHFDNVQIYGSQRTMSSLFETLKFIWSPHLLPQPSKTEPPFVGHDSRLSSVSRDTLG